MAFKDLFETLGISMSYSILKILNKTGKIAITRKTTVLLITIHAASSFMKTLD
jgi:hypothetical protein